MKELVSVIIPFYNEEQYIGDCLISLIKQTYKNIEIICVDDVQLSMIVDTYPQKI